MCSFKEKVQALLKKYASVEDNYIRISGEIKLELYDLVKQYSPEFIKKLEEELELGREDT